MKDSNGVPFFCRDSKTNLCTFTLEKRALVRSVKTFCVHFVCIRDLPFGNLREPKHCNGNRTKLYRYVQIVRLKNEIIIISF